MVEYRVVNEADGYEYRLKLVQELPEPASIPGVAIAAGQPEQNTVFQFQGKTQQIQPQFWIYDDGTNKAEDAEGNNTASTISDGRITSTDGSGDTAVVTVEEQIAYIKDYLVQTLFGTQFYLEGGNYTWDWDDDGNDENTPCAVTNVDIRRISTDPTRAVGRFDLEVGVVL